MKPEDKSNQQPITQQPEILIEDKGLPPVRNSRPMPVVKPTKTPVITPAKDKANK